MSLDNEFYKFETTSSKISQSTVQNVTAGYIETLKQFIILICKFVLGLTSGNSPKTSV